MSPEHVLQNGPIHAVGDAVRLWKPGYAEHGAKAVVTRVLTIEEYGGPRYRGPWAYEAAKGFRSLNSDISFGKQLPDAMVVSEAYYLASLKWGRHEIV